MPDEPKHMLSKKSTGCTLINQNVGREVKTLSVEGQITKLDKGLSKYSSKFRKYWFPIYWPVACEIFVFSVWKFFHTIKHLVILNSINSQNSSVVQKEMFSESFLSRQWPLLVFYSLFLISSTQDQNREVILFHSPITFTSYRK